MTTTIASPAEYDAAIAQLTEAATAYYAPADDTKVSPLTDLEYDALIDAVRAFEDANPDLVASGAITTAVAAGVVTGDVPHPTPMLSLDKATETTAVEKFVGRLLDAGERIVLVQPKLDGLAIRAVYRDAKLVQVVTRGDGQAGEDITDRILRDQVTVAGLPRFIGTSAPVAFEVRGELVMSRDDFLASNANRVAAGKTAFANPRNATAGSARVETLTYDVRMSFVTYDHTGFPADPDAEAEFLFADRLPGSVAAPVNDPSQVLAAIESFGAARPEYDYPTDGIVLKAQTDTVREALGAGSRAPKWAIAYKYEAQTGETVIRDIIVEVGRTGNLSFTAVFDPVLVDGSTISRASLHNVEQIARLDVRIGSKAVVYKANDIIPQVLSVENDPETTEPWTPPTEDEDGYPYDQNQVIWRSTNPSAFLSGLIAYAASRDVLDIDGLGREVAEALVVSAGVENIADLFTLTADELANLDMGETKSGSTRRLGSAVAAKIIANIANAKTQPLNRVITALGIRLTGRTFGRRLAAHFKSLNALLAASVEDLMDVEGIGDGRADVIYAGLRKNEAVISDLIEYGVTSVVEDNSDTPKPLLGADGKPLSVVVTGAMTGKLSAYGRTQMTELIEQHGGKASGSVSKNTGLLVCGEVGSSKWQKATDLGVRIVTPEEFAAELGL